MIENVRKDCRQEDMMSHSLKLKCGKQPTKNKAAALGGNWTAEPA